MATDGDTTDGDTDDLEESTTNIPEKAPRFETESELAAQTTTIAASIEEVDIETTVEKAITESVDSTTATTSSPDGVDSMGSPRSPDGVVTYGWFSANR